MKIKEINPPNTLQEAILTRIQKEKIRIAKINFILKSFLAGISAAGIVPAVKFLVQDIKESGIYEYISLFFSDSGIVLSFWKQFSMSIIESMPVLTLSLSLALAGLFIWSFSGATRNMRIITA